MGSSSQSKSDSTPPTPKSGHLDDNSKYLVRNIEGEDNISLVSLGSQASLNSHVSSSFGTFDIINKTEDSLPEIEFLADVDIAQIKIDTNNSMHEANITHRDSPLSMVQQTPKHIIDSTKDIWIGHITEQPLINYIVRLIASKFLLTGMPNELLSDKIVRVSIKSLSLLVLGNCIDFSPHVLQLGLQISENSLCIGDYFHSFDSGRSDDDDDGDDDDDNDSLSVDPDTVEEKKSEDKQDNENELVVKEDHFGESSTASNVYFDFLSPLSKSADNVLLSQLKSVDSHFIEKKTKKLNTELTDLLSKSDIVESKTSYMQFDRIPSVRNTPKKILRKMSVKQAINFDEIDENQQFIEDILLYYQHNDPILRANTQIIVGNFIGAVLVQTGCFAQFLQENCKRKLQTYNYLQFNKLLQILLKVSQHLY